jgi:hypothetical protein
LILTLLSNSANLFVGELFVLPVAAGFSLDDEGRMVNDLGGCAGGAFSAVVVVVVGGRLGSCRFDRPRWKRNGRLWWPEGMVLAAEGDADGGGGGGNTRLVAAVMAEEILIEAGAATATARRWDTRFLLPPPPPLP